MTPGLPRPAETALAAAALLVLLPVLLVVAVAIRVTSGPPVLYRQRRVGRCGQHFRLVKFRTMQVDADVAGRLTVGDDRRVTRLGAHLRRHRLDELPQLWNVVRGDMSLVGPRPEVPEFVDTSQEAQAFVLRYRPGLTDPASLAFLHEADILAAAEDPAAAYREQVLPAKLAISTAYLHGRTARSDLAVLGRTLSRLLRHRAA